GIGQRQRSCNVGVIWLIFAQCLQRIARLLSGSFCTSGIAGEALRESQHDLINDPLDLSSKVELSLSGLQQSNGITVIPFKPQLNHLDVESILNWSLRVY